MASTTATSFCRSRGPSQRRWTSQSRWGEPRALARGSLAARAGWCALTRSRRTPRAQRSTTCAPPPLAAVGDGVADDGQADVLRGHRGAVRVCRAHQHRRNRGRQEQAGARAQQLGDRRSSCMWVAWPPQGHGEGPRNTHRARRVRVHVQISAAIAEVLRSKLKVDPSRFYLKVRRGGQRTGDTARAPCLFACWTAPHLVCGRSAAHTCVCQAPSSCRAAYTQRAPPCPLVPCSLVMWRAQTLAGTAAPSEARRRPVCACWRRGTNSGVGRRAATAESASR
jgi:hypothetical protein